MLHTGVAEVSLKETVACHATGTAVRPPNSVGSMPEISRPTQTFFKYDSLEVHRFVFSTKPGNGSENEMRKEMTLE
jgi:hypothetical protein